MPSPITGGRRRLLRTPDGSDFTDRTPRPTGSARSAASGTVACYGSRPMQAAGVRSAFRIQEFMVPGGTTRRLVKLLAVPAAVVDVSSVPRYLKSECTGCLSLMPWIAPAAHVAGVGVSSQPWTLAAMGQRDPPGRPCPAGRPAADRRAGPGYP